MSSLRMLEFQQVIVVGDISDISDDGFTERRKNEEIKHI